jgi:hypothetical protein
MAVPNTTYRIFVEKLGASSANNFVGDEGDLFYDPNNGEIRISNGTTPGGINKITQMIAYATAMGM